MGSRHLHAASWYGIPRIWRVRGSGDILRGMDPFKHRMLMLEDQGGLPPPCWQRRMCPMSHIALRSCDIAGSWMTAEVGGV